MVKDVILFSGGMDSYVGDLFLNEKYYSKNGETLLPLYIDYKGSACKKEKEIVKKIHPYTQIIDNVLNLQGMEHGVDNFLFGRNMYFCLLAAPITSKIIYLCGLENSMISDNTAVFYNKASELLTQIKGEEVIVASPFVNSNQHLSFCGMEKEEVVNWYVCSGYSLRYLLEHTSSCYFSEYMYCGNCLGCFNFYCAVYPHIKSNKLRWLKAEYRFKNKYLVKRELDEALKGWRSPIRTKTIKDIAFDLGVS